MRFETWRGMPLALAMAAFGWGLGWVGSARADGYHLRYTIPRLVPAYDFTTGGEFRAPPVPYGHYAKDHLYNPYYLMSCVSCRLHGLMGCCGGGLGPHGAGGCGHGTGCGACGGKGDGLCSGGGLFGHHATGPACLVPGCAGGRGCGHQKGAGRFGPVGAACGAGTVTSGAAASGMAVAGTAQSVPSGVAVVGPSGRFGCGRAGCGIQGHHGHHGLGKHAGRCGDPSCGWCRGGGHGHGRGCGFCGGTGCPHCLGHGQHGLGLGALAGLLHHPKIDYFVGAGGPVPLTPGYVPYIVVTRSPREFFAFPPMNPNDP